MTCTETVDWGLWEWSIPSKPDPLHYITLVHFAVVDPAAEVYVATPYTEA